MELNEHAPSIKGKSKVLVIFLEDYQNKNDKKERIMRTFGSWEDHRNAEQIIDEIYSSRVSGKEDFSL